MSDELNITQNDMINKLIESIDLITNKYISDAINNQPTMICATVTNIDDEQNRRYGVTYRNREVYAKNVSLLDYKIGDEVYILYPTGDEGDANVILLGAAAATTPINPVIRIPNEKIKALFGVKEEKNDDN